jgi:predicted nucleic acid-binding protein
MVRVSAGLRTWNLDFGKLPRKAWETAIRLARRFAPTIGVRTLDSLHVACALELKAQKFWTFDDRQARLAEVVGLDTSA